MSSQIHEKEFEQVRRDDMGEEGGKGRSSEVVCDDVTTSLVRIPSRVSATTH